MTLSSTPSALLFTAPGCPHCPGVKAALEKLLSEGAIASLEVVSISEQPERAAEFNVRSVPWLKLGEFILTGAHSPQALREWAEKARSDSGMTAYLEEMLKDGRLSEAETLLQQQPEHLSALLPLIEDFELPMQVRLGTSALFESFAGSSALQALVSELGRLSEHTDHRVRADACHYLGLSGSGAARSYLHARLNDPHPEVREIAQDTMRELDTN